MIVRCAIRLLFLGILSGLWMPGPLRANVRVIEDEVIFTLRAPKAKTVFLVGDFNNWNPTVEPMVKEGDVFEWSLFLVAGDYHYKFVVDGQWINDPDNPPEDPQKGSPLLLVETPRGLRIKEVDEEGRQPSVDFHPSARYIGRFTYGDEEFDAHQLVDVNIGVNDKTFSAKANFQSADDSWELSPVRSDILFDRGRFETQFWKCYLTAFENDTIWTSSDPFGLLGPRGIYRHDAGYGKRGLSLDIPLSGSISIKALFADKLRAHPFASAMEPDGLRSSSTGSAQGDSLIYAYRLGDEDSDVWGVEALVGLGDYQAGFVRRIDRGLHPGQLNTMQPLDSMFENAVYRTDERWEGMTVWIGAEISGSLEAKFAYGRGRAFLNRRCRTAAASDIPVAIDPGQTTDEWNSQQKIQESQRLMGIVDYHRSYLRFVIGMDYGWYQFKPDLFEDSEAKVLRSYFEAAVERGGWNGLLHLEYVEQDYGETPRSFHIYSPERNYWLRGGDGFLPETFVGLGEESFSMLRLTFSKGRRMFVSGNGNEDGRLWIFVEAGVNTDGMMKSFEYGYSRVSVERCLYDRFYAQLDVRGALYDNSIWESLAFLSSYVEAGYRRDRMEISAGFGFDPVVLDPVRNEYSDIGRTEWVRRAVGGMYSRGDETSIGKRLLDLEHALETDRTLKLECIIHF